MHIAIIGATGVVGRELLQLFSAIDCTLSLFASKANTIDSHDVFPLKDPIACDFAFFCAGSKISTREIPRWVASGATVIDLSSAFREEAPLIIPEINGDAIEGPLLTSPNCTTSILLMPLAPLHKEFRIKRIVASTYQAASGGGQDLLKQLLKEAKKAKSPQSIAYNLIPHSFSDESGHNDEEKKMAAETRKILNDPNILLTATCVRVPTLRVHAISANVEFSRSLSLKTAIEMIENTPGVAYFPGATLADVEETAPVVVSRIRKDLTRKNTFDFWILGDQLLKGAALNAFQIFATLVESRALCKSKADQPES